VDNAGKFSFRTDQQLVTALLDDGYEGEELFDALALYSQICNLHERHQALTL